MTEDLKDAFAGRTDDLRFIAELESADEADASPGFTRRVMSAIAASRRRRLLARAAAALVPAAAAAAVAVSLLLPDGGAASGAAADAPARTQAATSPQAAATSPQAGAAAPDDPLPGYRDSIEICAMSRVADADSGRMEAAVRRVLSMQRADGGWGGPAQSAWGAAALAAARSRGMRGLDAPYRKALRYLRRNGIAESSPADLARETGRNLPRAVLADPAFAATLEALKTLSSPPPARA